MCVSARVCVCVIRMTDEGTVLWCLQVFKEGRKGGGARGQRILSQGYHCSRSSSSPLFGVTLVIRLIKGIYNATDTFARAHINADT